ncbi:putative Sulfur carrier protein CysO [Candidatus Hydrogenisulfobacillus filiaventi]|uniref:Putative Sulfur carrier protein CysO n=1 Tax=Candidatus Hydrogenisulfobacillus filiaventi TaxID=2707344 RepID=A0A6F8ZD74_9FIRM|nr:putative Sulfur carrier protein CysO [Candidatus Hydrogenisulfobacillus filiaventi]
MAWVKLPGLWVPAALGTEVEVAGETVGAVLAVVAARYPALGGLDGRLPGYVNVYLNGRDIRTLEAGLDSPVGEGDRILLVPALAGG